MHQPVAVNLDYPTVTSGCYAWFLCVLCFFYCNIQMVTATYLLMTCMPAGKNVHLQPLLCAAQWLK
jgi:hypothetical protein